MTALSIGEFARASGLSAKALRLYDESGLVPPADVDPVTGYRRYHPEQLDRARLVARLRRLGLPLARVALVVDGPVHALTAEITSHARQVAAEARSVEAAVSSLVADLAGGPGEEHDMTTTTDRMILRFAATGHRLEQGGRAAQLDAVHVGERLLAVADGFGEGPSGAPRALAAFVDHLDVDGGVGALDAAVTAAGAALADLDGSGTTLTAVVVADREAMVAHVGDSRAYRVRDGRLEQLTHDHSLVQRLVDEGRLTPEEARTDEQRPVLSRALAPEVPTAADLAVLRIEAGDRLVLCTDGVHARLDARTLADLVLAGASPQQVCDALVAAVLDAGAEDNLAVLVADVAGTE